MRDLRFAAAGTSCLALVGFIVAYGDRPQWVSVMAFVTLGWLLFEAATGRGDRR